MKRIVLVVPDDFDAGSVISLIGRDLVMAHIGEYKPAVTAHAQAYLPKPNGLMDPEAFGPVIETGRTKREYTHVPGLTRQSAPRHRPGGKTSLQSIVEEIGASKEWFTGTEVEETTRAAGYAEDSGWKALSNMKIRGLLEHNKTDKLWRLVQMVNF